MSSSSTSQLSDYTFIKKLGEGGFGETFKARNDTDNKIYAIKKIFPMYGGNKPQRMLYIEQIANEIKSLQLILAICSDTAPCFKESFTENGRLYIVMDFIDGWNLESAVTGTSRIPLATRVYQYKHIVIDLISGLQRLHSLGLVHQDLKGENIMYDTVNKRFKFIDFGLACLLSTGIDTPNKKAYSNLINPPCGDAGNLLTKPPEFIDIQSSEGIEGNIYPETWLKGHDIWSLGCIFMTWFTFPEGERYNENDVYFGYTFMTTPDKYRILFRNIKQFMPDIYGLLVTLFQRDPQVRVDYFEEIMISNGSISTPENITPNWDDNSVTNAAAANLDVWKRQIKSTVDNAELEREMKFL